MALSLSHSAMYPIWTDKCHSEIGKNALWLKEAHRYVECATCMITIYTAYIRFSLIKCWNQRDTHINHIHICIVIVSVSVCLSLRQLLIWFHLVMFSVNDWCSFPLLWTCALDICMHTSYMCSTVRFGFGHVKIAKHQLTNAIMVPSIPRYLGLDVPEYEIIATPNQKEFSASNGIVTSSNTQSRLLTCRARVKGATQLRRRRDNTPIYRLIPIQYGRF